MARDMSRELRLIDFLAVRYACKDLMIDKPSIGRQRLFAAADDLYFMMRDRFIATF